MRTSISRTSKFALVALFSVAILGGGATVGAQPWDDQTSSSDNMMMERSDDQSMQPMHAGHDHETDNDNKADAWSRFEADYAETKEGYDKQVRNYMNMAYADMDEADAKPLYEFNDAYKTAWTEFEKDMAEAKDRASRQGMTGDEARNGWNDEYGRAMSDFMNRMEMAKNQLAQDMDEAGNAPAKDMFMNAYNATKDRYGQDMEKLRHELYESM